MNKLTTALAGSTLVLAATSGYLYVQLDGERSRAQASAQRVSACTDAAEFPLAARPRRPEAAPAQAQDTFGPSDSQERHVPPASGEAGAPSTLPMRIASLADGSEAMKPELRLTMTRRQYGGLLRELGLSEGEMDALMPVLVAQDDRRRLATGRFFLPPASLDAPPEEEQQRERDRDEIAQVIGHSRAAQFERLVQMQPARNQLRLHRLQLEQAGEPLSRQQEADLLSILVAQKPLIAPDFPEGASAEQREHSFRSWHRDRERRVIDEARRVLSPRQVERLEEDLALREAFMRPPTTNLGRNRPVGSE